MTASGANGGKRRQDLHRFTNSVYECSFCYLIKINLSLIILSKGQKNKAVGGGCTVHCTGVNTVDTFSFPRTVFK